MDIFKSKASFFRIKINLNANFWLLRFNTRFLRANFVFCPFVGKKDPIFHIYSMKHSYILYRTSAEYYLPFKVFQTSFTHGKATKSNMGHGHKVLEKGLKFWGGGLKS